MVLCDICERKSIQYIFNLFNLRVNIVWHAPNKALNLWSRFTRRMVSDLNKKVYVKAYFSLFFRMVHTTEGGRIIYVIEHVSNFHSRSIKKNSTFYFLKTKIEISLQNTKIYITKNKRENKFYS